MLSLGVFGTAKNTGKTTVLNAVLRCLWGFGSIALTSIGFDGEDLDHITGLPKPKVVVDEGILVVTSKEVVWRSTAKLVLLSETRIETTFGPLGIYRVKSSGRVPLVGPNSSDALLEVKDVLKSYDPKFLLVDGAINRMVPFQHVDYIILATGASRSRDLKELLLEAKTICKALALPKGEAEDRVFLSGPIELKLLEKYKEREIVVESPFHLLLVSDYETLFELLNKVKIFVLRRPELLCVTLNPSYPEKRVEGFRLAMVDLGSLKKLLIEEVHVPCIDVLREEDELFKILESKVIGKWAFMT